MVDWAPALSSLWQRHNSHCQGSGYGSLTWLYLLLKFFSFAERVVCFTLGLEVLLNLVLLNIRSQLLLYSQRGWTLRAIALSSSVVGQVTSLSPILVPCWSALWDNPRESGLTKSHTQAIGNQKYHFSPTKKDCIISNPLHQM